MIATGRLSYAVCSVHLITDSGCLGFNSIADQLICAHLASGIRAAAVAAAAAPEQ